MVTAIALTAAACGGEPAFKQGSFDDVEQALTRTGLDICATTTPDRLVENATEERSFDVAIACADEDQVTSVDVIAWPDQGARDEAIRRFEAQSRPSSQNHGLQLAYGPFTIDVSGTRDEDVTARIVDAMNDLGAD